MLELHNDTNGNQNDGRGQYTSHQKAESIYTHQYHPMDCKKSSKDSREMEEEMQIDVGHYAVPHLPSSSGPSLAKRDVIADVGRSILSDGTDAD
eukprot:1337228-Amorphochlora_amoeboformis.AAC.1